MFREYILPGIVFFAIFYALAAFVLPVALDKEIERQRAYEQSLYERGYIQ